MNIEKAKAELLAAMTGPAGENWGYGPAVKTLLKELAAKDTELQEYRKAGDKSAALASLEAEPVSFDDLRDAVAEVSGGPAMEWSDIYKGHQAVPFINFNSLARIVDKFRTASPAPVSVPKDIPDSVFDVLCQASGGGGKACDFADELWNACRAAMLQAVPAELQECRETQKDESNIRNQQTSDL